MENVYDVIIIGSGPAGLTAAIYTTRANLKTLIIGGRKWGGQLMLTTLVENFPGFPEGIQGPDLMANIRKQAEHHGAEIKDVDFKEADYSSSPIKIKTDDDHEYQGKTVIIATGADTKWLGVPGEQEKIGRGVSSCAPCDGAFFRNKNVIVVGGGDSAMEEALVMTKFATEVTLIHRRDSFRASDIMVKRVKENPKIKIILNTEITEVLGEFKVEGVKLKTTKVNNSQFAVRKDNKDQSLTAKDLGGKELNTTGDTLEWRMPIDGIFVAVGHIPNSAVFKGIDTDEKGFIKVYEHTKTNIPNVYVAGDVHDNEYKQGITAAGFGCMAALEVEKFLMDQ
ncbi:MAG TPA: thioredoxin-disulfide reductase [Patescibacteria group bacterium]|nr:thioredoxin-disulfide reductase [Patescibacteria group bacterium]